jgi:hypothetical protein
MATLPSKYLPRFAAVTIFFPGATHPCWVAASCTPLRTPHPFLHSAFRFFFYFVSARQLVLVERASRLRAGALRTAAPVDRGTQHASAARVLPALRYGLGSQCSPNLRAARMLEPSGPQHPLDRGAQRAGIAQVLQTLSSQDLRPFDTLAMEATGCGTCALRPPASQCWASTFSSPALASWATFEASTSLPVAACSTQLLIVF